MSETWRDIDLQNPSQHVKESLHTLSADFGASMSPVAEITATDSEQLLSRIELALNQLDKYPEITERFRVLKEQILSKQILPTHAATEFYALISEGSTLLKNEIKPAEPLFRRFFTALRHTFLR